MFNKKELRFERRSILTAAQLRTIEKFPREFFRLMFAEYDDGIICGLDFTERDEKIFLTEGLLKIGDAFYFAEEINLSAMMRDLSDGVDYKFVLGEPQRTASENVITEKISLTIAKLDEQSALEFGRFRHTKIKLPDGDAENLFDEFTKGSRLNLLDVSFSTRGGKTFHPYIFRALLKKLEQKNSPSPADVALMIQLANFGSASVHALKIYVKANNVSWQDDSREKIFKSVLAAVEAVVEINLPEKNSTPTQKKIEKNSLQPGLFIWD